MAKSTQFKLDATRPFYAVVGVTDIAVEFARSAATDVQARFANVELEPKALRDQAQALPAKVESYVSETVAELNESYDDLAVRGKNLVTRIRKQQATQDATAAGKTTVAKAKTTRTQTAKSASNAAASATTAAKKSAGTAKRNVKATSTSAKKAASATTEATGDAASKVGN
jgi:CCR4-NOT transcriptional regulation complex NOT5 subunit